MNNITEENILNNANSGEVTSADIRRELFEGDNIITDFKGNDRGLAEVLENEKRNNIIVEETEEQLEEASQVVETTEEKIPDETRETVKDDKVDIN